jgi:glycosyltransferase involved in cell wall biosynthesis
MRIFYYLSNYISHYLAGLDYVDCLEKSGHMLCAARPKVVVNLTREQMDFAERADVIVLHEEPQFYASIYEHLSFLREKRVIAYAVWENEVLSPFYIKPLQLVSEVWTCSDFCASAISPHVRKCSVLPHLVQRPCLDGADLQWGRAFLDSIKSSGRTEEFIFLSVIDAINPRKNLQGLLTAFNLLQSRCQYPVRLLLKQYRLDMQLPELAGVTSLYEDLSQGRMNALYALCDAYVSAHHAEGWGMGLSGAMAFGKPVIATGYSGNMQYMNSENSVPVPYALAPVSDDMLRLVPLFVQGMRWAEPDLLQMAAAMRKAAEKRLDAAVGGKAAAVTSRFGAEKIRARLNELLMP